MKTETEKTAKAAGKPKKRRKLLKVLATIVIVVYLLSGAAFFAINHLLMFVRYNVPDADLWYLPLFSDHPEQPYTEVSIEAGKETLAGYLFGARNDKALVVVCQGLDIGVEFHTPDIIWFASHGYRVLAFDGTGCGKSTGSSSKGGAQSLIDLRYVLDYVAGDASLSALPLLLYGHSWGGYSTAAAIDEYDNIRGVASLSGYDSPVDVTHELIKMLAGGFVADIEYPFIWLDQIVTFGFGKNKSASAAINNTDTPILLVYGDADENYTKGIATTRELTNPNAELYLIEEDGRDGHQSIFFTMAANEYRAQVEEEYYALMAQYKNEVPDDVMREFCKGVDKVKIAEVDQALFNRINTFFEGCIA